MPPNSQSATEAFDIVAKYHSLITSDPSLTPPIAAIESLIALLTSTPATTVSETLDLLQRSSTNLRKHIKNSIPLSAGTDLFQRYLVTTLQRPGALGPGGDFSLLRQHLISNSRLFVQRAKEARSKIATHALPFVRDDVTILTYGPSRVVSTLLAHAADERRYFNVIYVVPSPSTSATASQVEAQVSTLRSLSIPTATIPAYAVAHTLATSTSRSPLLVLVGASAVLENGGALGLLGTYQLALLAQALKKPFYVAAESYKFVRMYPLSQADLPVDQEVVKYQCDVDPSEKKDSGVTKEEKKVSGEKAEDEEMIDVTPPNLISALITENGVMTPSAVSEELIKLWF